MLSRIAGEIARYFLPIPLSVQRRFPELENRHVDFLKTGYHQSHEQKQPPDGTDTGVAE
ncbi:terminase small subunit [Escherichia coli]